ICWGGHLNELALLVRKASRPRRFRRLSSPRGRTAEQAVDDDRSPLAPTQVNGKADRKAGLLPAVAWGDGDQAPLAPALARLEPGPPIPWRLAPPGPPASAPASAAVSIPAPVTDTYTAPRY